ncbi:MAG: helicase-related protein, partial [Planctomycetota bacterium]
RLPTRYFATLAQKWSAIAQEVHVRHATGQPILIGTKTIDESEVLAHHFCQLNIPHQLLNGKQDRSEADIVAAAGREHAVTIATNMAGRGTDIQLSETVRALGGLHVIQTQRQESARVDRQLIGRCGRQGQPGSHQCFVSAEDPMIASTSSALTKQMQARCEPDVGVERAFDAAVDQVQAELESDAYQQRQDLYRQDQWLEDVLSKVATQDRHPVAAGS